MNLRKNNGVTMIALVVTIIIILIIASISITGTIRGKDETVESKQFSELGMIQHAVLERYTKAQLTKEDLPGTQANKSEVLEILNKMKELTGKEITLQGKDEDYKSLSKEDLSNLGISNTENEYIVNYKTGEVIDKTSIATKSGKALYLN